MNALASLSSRYFSDTFTPLHRMADRLLKRNAPPAPVVYSQGLTSERVRILHAWGYTFTLDGDRDRILAHAPDDGRCLQNKVFPLSSTSLLAFVELSAIEE